MLANFYRGWGWTYENQATSNMKYYHNEDDLKNETDVKYEVSFKKGENLKIKMTFRIKAA